MSEPTTEDPRWSDPVALEFGIHRALEAGDIEAVGHFLRRMAVVDPARAVRVYDEMKAAIAIAEIVRVEP